VLEAIVLSGVPSAGGHALAAAYARLLDARVRRLLTETVWERTLARVGPDGRLSRAAALDLFALAYGPLPRTKSPPGRVGRVEGTIAGMNILRLWSTLTTAQRRAALRRLGLTGVVMTRGRAPRRDALPWRLPWAIQAAPPNYGDPRFTPDEELTKAANEWARAITEGRLRTPSLRIVAGETTDSLQIERGQAWADAYSINDQNGRHEAAANVCRIRFGPAGQQKVGIGIDVTLAHEVFHCIQYDILGLGLDLRASWLVEGSAEWAALEVTPVVWGQGEEGYLRAYLETCGAPLFDRTYSAVGFFGSVQNTFGDDLVWTRVIPALRAGTNEASFKAAGGGEDAFLDSWGSWMALESGWNFHWWLTRPLVPSEDAKCVPTPIPPSGGPFATSAFASDVFRLSTAPPKKPLLHVIVRTGHARLSDGKLDTTNLKSAWFCTARDERECRCPPEEQGKVPPAAQLSLPADIGIAGGRTAPRGRAAFVSLKQFCKKKQKRPSKPRRTPPIGGGGSGCGKRFSSRVYPAGRNAACGGGCTSGCGASNGDPHLRMFDGRFYDFQGAGEYTLVRSKADNLEVQVREQPYPGSKTLAINTAVAMRVAGDRVAVYGSELVVRVNGGGFVPRAKPTRLPHGGTIRGFSGALHSGHQPVAQVEVEWPDGTIARVYSVSVWGVAVLLRPAPSRQRTLTGLLGNFDGLKDDDFVTRGGERLPTTALIGDDRRAYRLLYAVLGESWRVTQRQSLFDYAPGQSTRTFTNRRFPARILTPAALPVRARRVAERACRGLGIRHPRILRDCILDVGGTGDGRFATSARELERTAGRFGRPRKRGRGGGPPPGGSVGHWTRIATARSALGVPSLALDGSKVVAAYASGSGSAEAATFTLSGPSRVGAVWRDPILSGWNYLGNLSLLARPGGGLQVLLHGIHGGSTGDPLSGEIVFPRNADGSFGSPTRIATADQSALGGAAALAPDGTPLWASVTRGFWLWRGFPEATSAGLSTLPGPAYIPSIGRDATGRYWLAWYVLGRTAQTRGLYLVQIDPKTLQPASAPQRAPLSSALENLSSRIALACAAVCRVVYLAPANVVSWAWGERRPSRVFARRHTPRPELAAAYTARGRLWVVWFDRNDSRYGATLGNAAGAGGPVLSLGHPGGTAPMSPGAPAGLAAGERLALVVNWSGTSYVKIVSP
jgi:hypothetical protein